MSIPSIRIPQDNYPSHKLDLSYLSSSKANDSGISSDHEASYGNIAEPQESETTHVTDRQASATIADQTASKTQQIPMASPSVTFQGNKTENVSPFAGSVFVPPCSASFLLAQMTSYALPDVCIPLSTQISILQLRFYAHPDQVYSSQLQRTYYEYSSRLETSRLQICISVCPQLLPTHMQHYDQLHSSLIDYMQSMLDSRSVYATQQQTVQNSNDVISQGNLQSHYLSESDLHLQKRKQEESSSSMSTLVVPQPASSSESTIQSSTLNLATLQETTSASISSSCIRTVESNNNTSSLTQIAVDIMNRWYDQNSTYPYPSRSAMKVMADKGGIAADQVKKWFSNKRQRVGFTKNNPQMRVRGKKRAFDQPEQLILQEMATMSSFKKQRL